jgi:nicotinamide-nucleotide adenylyltransferase
MSRALYIGRFQPFHGGHREVVERIAEESDVDELIVGIGSAGQSHSRRNPFTAGERHMMLTRALSDTPLETFVVPIEDIDRNALWVSHVQSLCPPFEVVYSNNPLVVRLFDEREIEVRQIPLIERDTYEGTSIRERMIEGQEWSDLVPDPVAETIREIEGVERLERVTDSDTNES